MESLTIYKSSGYAGCQTSDDPILPMVLLMLGKLDETKGINVPLGCCSCQPVAKWKLFEFSRQKLMSESKSTCQILIIALKWPILYLDSEIDFWRENQNSFTLLNI